MIIVEAKELRNIDKLKKLPKDYPGWYKWWAPLDALELLLNSQYLKDQYLHELLPYLTSKTINNQKYYYIYTGIAIKESIRARLNWHVNQHHTQNNVVNGFLSTLRQSISSLIANNQYDEEATNELIDKLIIEYTIVELPIKSREAKDKIEFIEKEEILNNVLPLNIKDNKNMIVKKYLKELSTIRKNSK